MSPPAPSSTAALPGILRQRLLEWVRFDSPVTRASVALLGYAVGRVMCSFGAWRRGFGLLAAIHRAGLFRPVDRMVERLTRAAVSSGSREHALNRAYAEHIEVVAPAPDSARWFLDPSRLLEGQVIVLKSPRENERGVVALLYLHSYRLFAKFYDLDAIARKYFIVLEPSWTGCCDPSILHYTTLREPVFVCATEPRDRAFLEGLQANFVVVPVANNTFVDDRAYYPIEGVRKDLDAVMVACWGWYKRHWAFFRALGALRRRGVSLRVGLAGYPNGLTRRDIEAQSRHFGVSHLIEWHENLDQVGINHLLNRARVNVLWSRREGTPRTIVEGMLAGVPCLVREGFNYGARYPYINSQTGAFASEPALPDVLKTMVETSGRYDPRSWAAANMTPLASTAVLAAAIRGTATRLGESWTADPVPKTSALHGMGYWNPADASLFEADRRALWDMRRPTRHVQP